MATGSRRGQQIAGLIIFALFLYLMHRLLTEYSYDDVVRELGALTRKDLVLALVFCALNYLVLTLYDVLAFEYIGRSLSYVRIALTAFISYTFSHNVGFALLSGGSVRYRLYSQWGLSGIEIAQVIAFSGLHFFLGLALVSGITLLIDPGAVGEALHIPHALVPVLGGVLLVVAVGYPLLGSLRRRPIRFKEFEFELPSPKLAIVAVVVAGIDWLLAAGVLYALIPPSAHISFSQVLSAFFLAQVLGLMSHVPGGLGVFESVMLLALQGDLQPSALLGSLIAFRAIYYLLPFVFGSALFVAVELRRLQSHGRVPKVLAPLERILALAVPRALSLAIFVGGCILLFSGATPTESHRLHWLNSIVPLGVLESSHFLNSLFWLGLLLLAWGIRKKLLTAYHFTVILLGAGAVVSLTKGLDYEEAAYLSMVLVLFLLSRRYFYRRSSILSALSPAALISILGILLASLWLGFFSYKHVEYQHELWWRFAFEGDAPRFLRASIGAAVLLLAVSVRFGFRPSGPLPLSPLPQDLETVERIMEGSKYSGTNLAYLRDKSFLFNDSRTAFLMYRVSGQTWVAMGDPVGPEDQISDLIWDLRDVSDQHDRLCAFYQISPELIPQYVDAGFKFIKLGEEAIVPLSGFSLEGGRVKSLRQAVNRLDKKGLAFEIAPKERIPELLPRLREISDQWLGEKNTREKGFSLGFFDEQYLSHFPLALVRREGEIVAFANIWSTKPRIELSLDLMRHINDVPNGVMDYLFVKLMLWGKEQGYEQFNLGMAPLSGVPLHRLAPLWYKLGSYLSRHGEHLYNFEGLRAYKEKFSPTWRPRYLAYSSTLMLPVILADVASLIARGRRGIFTV